MTELMFRCVPPVPHEPHRAGAFSQPLQIFDQASDDCARAPAITRSKPLFRQEKIDVA
jgi:hypothetical protein